MRFRGRVNVVTRASVKISVTFNIKKQTEDLYSTLSLSVHFRGFTVEFGFVSYFRVL